MWMFCWRWNSLPILIPAIAFLGTHDAYVSSRLAHLHAELAYIESSLLEPDHPDDSLDFSRLTRRLHEFSTALSNLARRAHFQDTVLNTVTEALCTLNGPAGFNLEIQRARLDGLKKAMLARQYDLEVMPKRELTARATVCKISPPRGRRARQDESFANTMIYRSSTSLFSAINASSSRLARQTWRSPGMQGRLQRPLGAIVPPCAPSPS